MSRTNAWWGLVVVLFIAAAPALGAKEKPVPVPAAPSVKKGDPPPGNAMALSIPQARDRLKEAVHKRYVGKLKARYSFAVTTTYVLSEATDVQVRTSGFEFAAPYSLDGAISRHDDGRVFVKFPSKGLTQTAGRCEVGPEDYLEAYRPDMGKTTSNTDGKLAWGHDKVVDPTPFYSVAYLPDPKHAMGFFQCYEDLAIFAWTDEAAAQGFADAFNRLLYAARRREMDPEFSAAAKAWRQNPTKPPLSPEADRERILAENALKEKNLDSVVEHYESALEFQPMWPAGWFNLALIYAEQNDYADAADRMKHYLELVPDAPDAKSAREQIIIWEDKSKH
jgi:hypothetical protein